MFTLQTLNAKVVSNTKELQRISESINLVAAAIVLICVVFVGYMSLVYALA